MNNKMDINLIVNGRDPYKSKWDDDTTFKELSEFVVDKFDQNNDNSYLFYCSAERQKQYALDKTFKEENIKQGATIYGFPLDFEEAYTITIVMPQTDPKTLDLQSDTTFIEVSDYFVMFLNSNQVSYDFFNDEKKTQKYDPTKTLKEEKIKNNQTIYGYNEDIIIEQIIINKEIIVNLQMPEGNLILIYPRNTTFEKLSWYFFEKNHFADKELLGYDFFQDQNKKKRFSPLQTLGQAIQDDGTIYGEPFRLNMKIRIIIRIPGFEDQTLTLTDNTKFKELSMFLIGQNLAIFKDFNKTIRCDPNKTLLQEHIRDQGILYGDDENEAFIYVQEQNHQIEEQDQNLIVMIDGQQPETLALPSDLTFKELEDYFIQNNNKDGNFIYYTFFSDEERTRQYDSLKTIKKENIKNGAVIYGLEQQIEQDDQQIQEFIFIMDGKQPEILALPMNTTFIEISDYFVESSNQDESQVFYVFFRDQTMTQGFDSNKTLEQENTNRNSLIYGNKQVIIQQQEIQRKEAELFLSVQLSDGRLETLSLPPDTTFNDLSEYFNNEQEEDFYQFFSNQQKSQRFDPSKSLQQESIYNNATIYGYGQGQAASEQPQPILLKEPIKPMEGVVEVDINLIVRFNSISSLPEMVALPKNTTFKELSEYFIEDHQVKTNLQYTFFQDEQMTKSYNTNKSLEQYKIRDNQTIYAQFETLEEYNRKIEEAKNRQAAEQKLFDGYQNLIHGSYIINEEEFCNMDQKQRPKQQQNQFQQQTKLQNYYQGDQQDKNKDVEIQEKSQQQESERIILDIEMSEELITLELPKNITFHELSDHFVQENHKDGSKVSYIFYKDFERKNPYEPSQSLESEKIKSEDVVYADLFTDVSIIKQVEPNSPQQRICD